MAIPDELAALGVAHVDDVPKASGAPAGVSSPQRPVLLCLPAMGAQAGYYGPFARQLATALGATVVLADLRGHGAWRRAGARRRFGYADVVEGDLPALVKQLATRYPARPLFAVGHSLGGQLAVLASAHVASCLAGIVLVAAGTAHWRAWPARHRRRAAMTVHAIRLVSALLPAYPGRWLGFGGNQPRRLMRDWSRNATTGAFALAGSAVDYAAALASVRLPVLSLRIEDDPIAPAGAADELVALLPAATRTIATARGDPTVTPWRRHFSWARRPEEIVAAIAPWIGTRCIRNAAAPVGRDSPLSHSFHPIPIDLFPEGESSDVLA